MPIKVLHVIQWPKGGIVSLVYNIILLLNNYGVESHVVFFNTDNDTIKKISKICQSVHSLRVSEQYLKSIINWFHLLRKLSPNIVHSHSFYSLMLTSLFNWQNNTCVSTVHGDYPYFKENRLGSIIKRTILKYCLGLKRTKVVAVSNSVRLSLIEAYINRKNIVLIENGINVAIMDLFDLNARKIRLELGIKTNDRVIISVGRLSKEKGFDILLKSFQIIERKYGNFFLLILGEGSERDNLMNLSMKLGLTNNVRLLGFKQNPFPYLAASDIYVCSSMYEGFGLSVAEAMLCKLPVVATNVGGIPSMITHGESGLLVEPGNLDAIADALENLILNRFDKEKLGKNARACIKNKYDIRITARSYFKLYKNIVDKRC